MEHARHAVDFLVSGQRPTHEYYKTEVLLLYYYGLNSPIVNALHSVTQVENIAVEMSQQHEPANSSSTRDDGETTMAFMEAYNHIHNFVLETMNVTLWAVSEKLDQSFLLMAQQAGLQLYEKETCLPLWDTIRQNVNPQRKRGLKSTEESIVAGIGRTVLSPGASIVHPLLLQAHDAWWTPAAADLNVHLAAFTRARDRYSQGVPEEVQEKRQSYKMFLQNEKFPRPKEPKKPGKVS